jgi:hypothetical protein
MEALYMGQLSSFRNRLEMKGELDFWDKDVSLLRHEIATYKERISKLEDVIVQRNTESFKRILADVYRHYLFFGGKKEKFPDLVDEKYVPFLKYEFAARSEIEFARTLIADTVKHGKHK